MRVRFPHGSLIDIAMCWNWQTHDAQNVTPLKAWEFKSPLGYYLTRVGQRPAEFHKLRLPGATPGLATELGPGTQTGKAMRSRASCLWVRLPPRLLIRS